MLNYTPRTHDEIVSAIISKVQEKNIGITNFSEGSVIRAIIDVFADEIQNTEEYINALNNCLTIFGMGDEELNGVGAMLGIERDLGTKPTGMIRFHTGDSPATQRIVIPQGYIVEADYEDETYAFVVAETKYIEIGEYYVDVAVIGESPRFVNFPPRTVTSLTDTLEGVFECYNIITIISGRDMETDEEFIERIRSSQYGLCSAKYVKEALLKYPFIDGVTIVDGETNGTYTIYMRLGGNYTAYTQLPDSDKITETLELTRPCGATYTIEYAQADDEVFTVTTNFPSLSTEQQDGIYNVIRTYLNTIDIGGTVYISQLNARIISFLLKYNQNASANVWIAGSTADYTLDTGMYFDIASCLVEIDGVEIEA